jgi:hypothetical protein
MFNPGQPRGPDGKWSKRQKMFEHVTSEYESGDCVGVVQWGKPKRAVWPRWMLKIVCAALMLWTFGWFEFAHGAQYGINACMMILSHGDR